MFNMCKQVQRLGGRKLSPIALKSQVVWLVHLLKQKVVGLVLDRDTSTLWGCVRKGILHKTQTYGANCCGYPFVAREQLKVAAHYWLRECSCQRDDSPININYLLNRF